MHFFQVGQGAVFVADRHEVDAMVNEEWNAGESGRLLARRLRAGGEKDASEFTISLI